jgi:hypothetical protein
VAVLDRERHFDDLEVVACVEDRAVGGARRREHHPQRQSDAAQPLGLRPVEAPQVGLGEPLRVVRMQPPGDRLAGRSEAPSLLARAREAPARTATDGRGDSRAEPGRRSRHPSALPAGYQDTAPASEPNQNAVQFVRAVAWLCSSISRPKRVIVAFSAKISSRLATS